MKKIFLNLTATAMLGLALTACNNEEANKKAAEADAAAVQTLVEDKMKAMDEEVTKACDEAVNAEAQRLVDSIAAAKPVAKTVVKKAPVKKAPAPAPVKKEEPKPQGGLKGKSDQTQQQSGGLKSKSDQAAQQQPAGGGGLRGKRDNP